jgi:adenylate kinase family enzyme
MKILFVGHPGAGKTYAATRLAAHKGVKEVDIDDLLHSPVNFFFIKNYRKAFRQLLKDKDEWIIDGYSGKRVPATIWDDADHIVYIQLPKSELRRNVYSRYRLKKSTKDTSHAQHQFANVLKNLSQIYLLDSLLKSRISGIQRSSNAHKLLVARSRRELESLLDKLGAKQ